MKNQKGITLIALIITIIVMVILAGVIITAAVADGGVIERAQDAIRENERADVQEIIISSYVFKVTASTNQLAYLDLGKTGIAIYDNLTTNGFTVLGAEETTEGSGIWTAPITGNDINISVEGKHGIYEGTVTEKGLEDDLKTKGEETNGDNNTGDNEEILWGEALFDGEVWLTYRGTLKELELVSDKIKVEEGALDINDFSFTGNKIIKEVDINDYNTISFVNNKIIETIDFNDVLSNNNLVMFNACSNLREVNGLEGIEQFDSYAFYGCQKLETIVLPQTLIKMPNFHNPENLKNVNIPNNSEIDYIDSTFSGGVSLEKITIPSNIKEIRNDVFNGCTQLKEVIISYGVEEIWMRVFNNCSSLEKITIPNSITSINETAFGGCISLKEVTINKTKAEVEAEGGIGTAWIPDSVTRIIYLDQTVDLKYEFTFGDVLKMKDAKTSDMWWIISPENFWTDNVSEELKNSTINRKIAGENQDFITYNITCENENYINIFDADSVDGVANAYGIMVQDGNIMFGLTAPDGDQIESENYSEYEDLKFTISMSE